MYFMIIIDLMHMTSQKGAPACWGSNEALSRAPLPSMKPAGQPLHAIPPGRPGPAHWLRGWERQRSSSTTRARSATSLDPQHGVVVMETWRQCIRSIPLPHNDNFATIFSGKKCARVSPPPPILSLLTKHLGYTPAYHFKSKNKEAETALN